MIRLAGGLVLALLGCGDGRSPLAASLFADDASIDGSGPDASTRDALVETFEAAPDDPTASSSKSGTRIRIRRLTTADGFSTVEGFFDSLLGVACDLRPAADGVMRCLPRDVAAFDETYFSDAACSVPAAVVDTTCATPAYAANRPELSPDAERGIDAACTAGAHFYALGAPLTEISAVSFFGCNAASLDGDAAYSLGDEIAATTFVGFTIGRQHFTAHLDALVYEGDDGSVVDVGDTHLLDGSEGDTSLTPGNWVVPSLFDVGHSARCTLASPTIDSTTPSTTPSRCAPIAVESDDFEAPIGYADGACKAPVYLRSIDCYGFTTSFATDYASDFYWLEGEYDGPFWFRAAAPSCSEATYTCAGCATSLVKVPITDLVTAVATTTGTARLVANAWALDGETLATHQAHDTALDVDCSFLRVADGSLRCIPGPAEDSSSFADASCTVPLVDTGSFSADDPTPYFFLPSYDACEVVAYPYVLAEQGPPQTYATTYAIDTYTGVCGPNADGDAYYTLTAPADLTRFVEATSATE